MDFLRGQFSGHFSPLTHNYFSSEKQKAASSKPIPVPNMSNEDHTVAAFVRENWQQIVTAFLLYMFAAATFTSLKGRELVAFSSMAAAWTVFQGISVWSLATAAPIIYGIGRVIFNWATTPSATNVQREPRAPVFPAHEAQSREAHASRERRNQTQVRREESSHSEQQDLRAFEEAWEGAQRTLRQPDAIKPSDGVAVVVAQTQKEDRSSTHTSPRSSDRQPTFIASPIGVATVIPATTSAHLQQQELEEAWDRVSGTEERDGSPTLSLSDPIDLEEGHGSSQLDLTSPLPNTVAEEEEVVVDKREPQQVKEKAEVSDRAITEQKFREARRIVWEFCKIANEYQARKISRFEPKTLVAGLLLNRQRFFDMMEVTPEQRIALLLPSVLTEAQAEKVSVGVEELYQAATHAQAQLFKYLELTASQKTELLGPPVQQLAKL